MTSGITSTGIRPRAHFGTFQPRDPVRDDAGQHAADDAAEEAGLRGADADQVDGQAPITNPGAMPGRSAMANAM